jgi:hypothetical protein
MLPPNVLRSDAAEPEEAPELGRSDLEHAQAVYAAAQRTARKSNLVSAVCALISIGGALVASLALESGGDRYSGGARLVGERAATKALNPDTNYVRLEELAIYQDQIVAGAVGTPELQDASVTEAKLATGAVTGDKLAAGSVSFSALGELTVAEIAGRVSNERMIVGEVKEDGSWRGSGFSSQRISTGEYRVDFSTEFAEPPIMVAVANSYGKCYANPAKLTTQSVTVICKTDLVTASPIEINMGFNFYAGVTPA